MQGMHQAATVLGGAGPHFQGGVGNSFDGGFAAAAGGAYGNGRAMGSYMAPGQYSAGGVLMPSNVPKLPPLMNFGAGGMGMMMVQQPTQQQQQAAFMQQQAVQTAMQMQAQQQLLQAQQNQLQQVGDRLRRSSLSGVAAAAADVGRVGGPEEVRSPTANGRYQYGDSGEDERSSPSPYGHVQSKFAQQAAAVSDLACDVKAGSYLGL